MDSLLKKSVKKFIYKLLVCIIIQEIVKGNITLEEVYILIDKAAEEKRRQELIRTENERFRRITRGFERFQQLSQRFRNNRNDSYQSFLNSND
jgi:hypothetical protein